MVSLRNILVTGSDGQIGRSIKNLASNYSYNIIFKKKCELNIINYVKFEEFLNENKINTLINCAAFTDVNYAEIKRKTANKINHLALEKGSFRFFYLHFCLQLFYSSRLAYVELFLQL